MDNLASTPEDIAPKMLKVLINNEQVYEGSYFNCCGFISCLNEPCILVDQDNQQIIPITLGYSSGTCVTNPE